MRALAEYVMRGRIQAVMVAVLATGSVFLAWIGAAVVALVTLRQGTNQGAYVLFWALLPALVIAWTGDTGPLSTLLGVTLAATVLRSSQSWPLALSAAATAGLLTGLALIFLGEEYLQVLVTLVGDFFARLQEQNESLQLAAPSMSQVAGLLGWGNALSVTLCLMLGRWWQSLLYNPGGFKEEFQSFRLPPAMTIVLLLVAMGVGSLGVDFWFWALIAALPFIFAGFGLVHGVAAKRQLNSVWLGLFYFSWLLLDPVKVVLLLAVIVDSWIDLRARVASRQA